MSAFLLRLNVLKCTALYINANKILNRSTYTTQPRLKWRRLSSGNVERTLLLRDNLPENWQLIYRAPLENYLTWTKNLSTLTVTIVGALAGYQLSSELNFSSYETINLDNLVSHQDDIWYFLVGFVLINLAIRVFVAKYPLRIYKDANKYVAVYSSQMPVGCAHHIFEKGQVNEYKHFLNPWGHIMYRLGNRSSMLLIDYFKTPSEFHQLFHKE